MNVIDFGPRACARIRGYLDSYINNELLVETNHEVLSHLETCPDCTAALEARVRVKERLQAAVRRERAPGSLRQNIQANLRRRPAVSTAWMRFPLAVAACLMLVLTGWNVLRLQGLRSTAPLESPQDMITSILKIGLGDHVHCALYRSYPKQPPPFEDMAAKIGPEYAGLVPIVSRQVQDHKVVLAHQCRFNGRHFVHMVLKREDSLISVILTKKTGLRFPALEGAPWLHQLSLQGLDVAGFEAGNYFVFVASQLPASANSRLAAGLAPPIRSLLVRVQG